MLTSVSIWMIKSALLGRKLGNAGLGGMTMMPKPSAATAATAGGGAALPSMTMPKMTQGAGRQAGPAPASSPQTISPTAGPQPGINSTMPTGPGP